MYEHLPSVHVARVGCGPVDGAEAVDVHLHLGELEVGDVRVQLYADGVEGDPAVVVTAEWLGELVGATNGHASRALLPAGRAQGDFTPRIVPWHPAASEPLENAAIRWTG